jgi:hypothetical protein
MMLRQPPDTTLRRLVLELRTQRGALGGAALLMALAAWLVVGASVFGTPMIGMTTQYDLVWPYNAGRLLFAGGDPYAPEFAAQMTGDPAHSAYPYPLASLWLMLPLLPLPLPWAAVLWVTISIGGLVALGPLLDSELPAWCWLAPLLFYPSLYALKIAQWAPLQMALLGLSLWLYRRGKPFSAGLILPLVAVKPPTGIALLLLALTLCGSKPRWWQGVLAGGLIWYGTPLLLQPDWPLRWIATISVYAAKSDQQYLVKLIDFPDGIICFIAAAAIAAWSAWRGRMLGLGCALLVLAMLATPHRAQYDYPLFTLPLLFLPRRHRWLLAVAVGLSWAFPLTFELGWARSLQLTVFTVAPAILACALVRGDRPHAAALQPTE